jgi:SPP1 family predicted phage head-tail adaptor
MQGGRLDRRIDIERKTVTQSPSGQPIETWSKIVARRAASVSPLRGDERFAADQYIARQQVEFRIRYSSTVADISPLDRIIYPPDEDSPADSPVATDVQIYDIMEVSEIGRREGLRILAARRVEDVE